MKKDTFLAEGIQELPNFFDPVASKYLLETALKTRNLPEIFLTEAECRAEFRTGKKFIQFSPQPGRNLIEKLNTNFIFSSTKFQEEMVKVCGEKWKILDCKLVMGVPFKYIPNWLNAELDGKLVANLGPYVKEQYRDITYFRGIYFHQDNIDFPDRAADFITAYLYLDDVDENTSPIHLLLRSHVLGASVFPYKLEEINSGNYKYINDFGDQTICQLKILTGGAGSLYYWHSSILHGTLPHINDKPRLSLRIIIAKNSETHTSCLLDQLNSEIKGNLSLTQTKAKFGLKEK